jgi:type-F conjugative transfer system protein TrbI
MYKYFNWHTPIFNVILVATRVTLGIIGLWVLIKLSLWVFYTPRLVSINMTQVIDHFVAETAKEALSPDQAKKRIAAFSHRLDQTLSRLATENHWVLLQKEAVLTGCVDVTPQVETALSKEAL